MAYMIFILNCVIVIECSDVGGFFFIYFHQAFCGHSNKIKMRTLTLRLHPLPNPHCILLPVIQVQMSQNTKARILILENYHQSR